MLLLNIKFERSIETAKLYWKVSLICLIYLILTIYAHRCVIVKLTKRNDFNEFKINIWRFIHEYAN